MPEKTTVQVLRDAREIIASETNWGQQDLCSADGRYCAVGAVAAALGLRVGEGFTDFSEGDGRTLKHHPAVAALARIVNDPVAGSPMAAVYNFNDDTDDHGTVLALFDRAIEVEEAKQAEQSYGALIDDTPLIGAA